MERKLIFLQSWANERIDAIATPVSSDLMDLYNETMSLIKLEAGIEGEVDADGALRLQTTQVP